MHMSKPGALEGAKAIKTSPEGAAAVPEAMKALGLVKTGPYLHEADHLAFIEFPGGDIPRSFTVVLAVANISSGMRLDRNGIAIIDNDNWAVIADEIGAQASGIRGASEAQKQAFAKVTEMNWSDFTYLLRNSKTFRAGKAADVDAGQALPVTGNFDRQARLGLRTPAEKDLRDEFMRGIDEMGAYRLPYASRRTIINELLLHPASDTRNGQCLSWNVSMAGYSWNKSGHVEDGEETHAGLDQKWERALRKDPTIVVSATDRFLTPYVRDSFSALEMENAESSLDVVGIEDDRVVLREFNGASMEFTCRRDLRAKLEEMSDEGLASIWATVRVLDHDLSRAERAHQVALELNTARAELEVEWLQGDQEQDLDLYALAS